MWPSCFIFATSTCSSRRDCGSSPVVGSSRNTSSGLLTNASASASRCRWPPDSVSNGASRLWRQREPVEHRLRLLAVAVERAEQRQRLPRRDLVLQGRRLQRGPDLLLDVVWTPARVDAADLDVPFVRLPQADDALDGGRLAGSVGTEQAEDLAVLDLEAHAPRGLDLAVPLPQVPDDHLRRHQPSQPLMMVSRRSKPNARSVTTTIGGP